MLCHLYSGLDSDGSTVDLSLVSTPSSGMPRWAGARGCPKSAHIVRDHYTSHPVYPIRTVPCEYSTPTTYTTLLYSTLPMLNALFPLQNRHNTASRKSHVPKESQNGHVSSSAPAKKVVGPPPADPRVTELEKEVSMALNQHHIEEGPQTPKHEISPLELIKFLCLKSTLQHKYSTWPLP